MALLGTATLQLPVTTDRDRHRPTMNQAAFLGFCKAQGIDISDPTDEVPELSVTGTYVSRGESKDDIEMRLVRLSSNSWRLEFAEHRAPMRSLPLPISGLVYSCTFLQLPPDIVFFSSRSKALAKITAAISILSREKRVDIGGLQESFMRVAFATDKPLHRLRLLFEEPTPDLSCSFVDHLEPGDIYTCPYGFSFLNFVVIPYVDENHDKTITGEVACFYPLEIPDVLYPADNYDGIIQGIRDLAKRIEQAESDLVVETETPLENTKQKIRTDIGKLEAQIDLKKQNMMWQLNQPNSELLEQVIRTVRPPSRLSAMLDFKQSYSIPGTDAAEQILKIANSVA